jgi:hypothetical protein
VGSALNKHELVTVWGRTGGLVLKKEIDIVGIGVVGLESHGSSI